MQSAFDPTPTRSMRTQYSWVRRAYPTLWRTLFTLALGSVVIGFLFQDDFKRVEHIHPSLTREPVQNDHIGEPIRFDRDGFRYTLEPVASYDIRGMVVHRLLYDRWFSMSRTDKLFTTDLCIVWGDNLTSGAYQTPSLRVTQDFRFCIYRYTGQVHVDPKGFSNNHLLTTDPAVEEVIRAMRPGDQVHLVGRLVHVHAQRNSASAHRFEPAEALWHTSTIRTDTGPGACEVLYVEHAELLRVGNVAFRTLFTVGLWTLTALVAVSTLRMFLSPFLSRRARAERITEGTSRRVNE